jgi:hypothetical protein
MWDGLCNALKIKVSWDVTPCQLVNTCRRFEHYAPSATVYQTTRRNIPEDLNGNEYRQDTVLWLRRLVAVLSRRRPEQNPNPVLVGFMVDKVAMGQVLLRVLWFSPASIVSSVLCTRSFLHHRLYINSAINGVIK